MESYSSVWGRTMYLVIMRFMLDDVTGDVDSYQPFTSPSPNWHTNVKESTLLDKLCAPGVCRNGQCYVRASATLCYCQALFKGQRCEYVDMEKVSHEVIGSTVILQWPRPPRLEGYSFVYYEIDDPDSIIYKRDIKVDDTERAALVGNLKSGYTTYRICIEDERLAERVVSENSMQYLSNCINLTTQPDYHTLAAWCIYVMLVCVAVLLIYSQKDKFELLYFSKPVFLSYEQEPDDKDSETS